MEIDSTEIRDFEDGQTIIVHTDDVGAYRRLREWKDCQRIIPYERTGKNPRVIAYDLYFPKRLERQLKKALGLPVETRKATSKQLEALASGRTRSPIYRGSRGMEKGVLNQG